MNQRRKRNNPPARKPDFRNSSRDPHFQREASRYEHPVASRAFILDTLTRRGVPVPAHELERLLQISDDDRDAFGKRLSAM